MFKKNNSTVKIYDMVAVAHIYMIFQGDGSGWYPGVAGSVVQAPPSPISPKPNIAILEWLCCTRSAASNVTM